MLTFLFLGIDKMTEVVPAKNGIDGGQSDAIKASSSTPPIASLIMGIAPILMEQ